MSSLPDYDSYQASFHQAFRPELLRIVDSLPLPAGGHALDVPCGGGFYTARLAPRCGRVTAVDVSDEYLNQTRERLAALDPPPDADVRKADAYELPFAEGTFDLVFCAQSMISLDPAPAVREMHRVCKPGGAVAILEADEYHHVLLPWPVELEAVLPAALLRASRAKYGDGEELAPARRLRAVLREAGFSTVGRKTSTADRAAPFDPSAAAFLREHLAHLRELVYPHLTEPLRAAFDAAAEEDSGRSFLRRPDAEFVVLNAVFVAVK